MGITTVLVPYSYNLWHFYLLICIYGLGAGVWMIAYKVWILEMFPSKSGSLFNLTFFMYGLGTILGPLIEGPYLTGEIGHNYNESYVLNSTIELMAKHDERRNKLKKPFLIIGVIGLIGKY